MQVRDTGKTLCGIGKCSRCFSLFGRCGVYFGLDDLVGVEKFLHQPVLNVIICSRIRQRAGNHRRVGEQFFKISCKNREYLQITVLQTSMTWEEIGIQRLYSKAYTHIGRKAYQQNCLILQWPVRYGLRLKTGIVSPVSHKYPSI